MVSATLAVTVCHAGVVLLLYPHGKDIRGAGLPAEFVVIWLPAILAYVVFFSLFRARRGGLMPPWISAFLLTVLSFWLSLLLPFNIYGT